MVMDRLHLIGQLLFKEVVQLSVDGPKKGAFPNENALLKLLFIRTKELQKKWSTGYIPNWSMVMNQLLLHDQIKDRVIKYLE